MTSNRPLLDLPLLLIMAAMLLSAVPALADGVLVFGGTGRLGSETVKQLIEVSEKVVVFARPTSDRHRLAELEVTFVVGDMLDKADMMAAFQSARPRIVIDASAISRGGYEEAARNIVAGASIGGVEQIIYHGSVGAGDNMALFPSIRAPELKTILADKGRAESVLIESGLTYTIIRNGLLESDDSLSTGNARITEDQTVLGRITRVDLAAVTMQCFGAQRCANKIFHATDDSLPVRLPTENAYAQ
jgi:uncharacterized protein YbjT (DUF2867 family)